MTSAPPSTDPAPDALARGAMVGRYVIVDVIARGGMGVVYAAYDTQLDRRLAIKLLRPDLVKGPAAGEVEKRMLREAQAMARLTHPNVVAVHDVGTFEGSIFLAMDFVDGTTLKEWLAAKPRSLTERLEVLRAAGRGLAAAHSAGLVHRDFKPDNVLVARDGRVLVTDFGLARAEGDSSPEEALPVRASGHTGSTASKLDSPLTLTGSILGTVGYVAPEQAFGEATNAATDQFSFAVTAYVALYGERPFPATDVEGYLRSIDRPVRDPPKDSDVPSRMHRAILRGLASDPAERFPSLDALLDALDADPAVRWKGLGAGLLLALAVLIGVGLAAQHARKREAACRAAADRLDGVWDEPTKASLARAFRATGVGYADDTWQRVSKRIDAYAGEATRASYDACAATRVRGEQSETMLDLRMACLDERLDELRAITRIFASADAKTVEKAVQVVSALDALEPCSDIDRLSAATRLPADPRERAEVRALTATIAEASGLRITGKQKQSREMLNAVEERVKSLAFGPVLVDWTMERAQVDRANDAEASSSEWESAVALSERYRLDRARAESLIELGRSADSLGHHADAHRYLRFAEATLERIGGDPRLELKLEGIEGANFYEESKYEDAARVLERGLETAARAHVDDPQSIATAHSVLGFALSKSEGRRADAVTEARAAVTVDEQAFGVEHPIVAAMLINLSEVEKVSGHYDESLAAAARGVQICEAGIARGELPANHNVLGSGLVTEGEALLRLGRASEAIALVERGRALASATGRTDLTVESGIDLAHAYADVGRHADAARVCAEAAETADRDGETASDIFVALLTVEAELELAGESDGAKAAPLAARAVTLAETGVSDPYDLASARLVLARALARSKRDPAGARKLAELARDGFARIGDDTRAAKAVALATEIR